jgi:hypothetical protein
LAKDARTSFQNAKIGEAITAERARQSQILGQELIAARNETLAERNRGLATAIANTTPTSSWGFLNNIIVARINYILGPTTLPMTPLKNAQNVINAQLDVNEKLTLVESTIENLRLQDL